jgi:hypothetical protein
MFGSERKRTSPKIPKKPNEIGFLHQLINVPSMLASFVISNKLGFLHHGQNRTPEFQKCQTKIASEFIYEMMKFDEIFAI